MRTIKTDYSMDQLISQVLAFKPQRLVFPYGWCGHIPFAAWLMKLHQPNVFVELGTHSGNSYFAFCQAASEYELPTLCYAVDTWEGDEHSGEYGEEVFGDVSAYNTQRYAGFSTLMRMRFDDALAYFSDGSIDLLHIDGLHTYEAVKADFESWLPKLSDRGIVVFHDINVREREFGVWRLWEELSEVYPHCSFYHSHGLGVLVVGSAVDPAIVGAIRSCDAQHMRLLFNTAADAVLERHLRLAAEKKLDASAVSLEALVHEQEVRVADLKSQLEAAQTEHAVALDRTVTALKQSLSWRVTAPLRWVALPLAALMHKMAVIRKSIELGGGVRKTVALALQVVRQEGVQGVRWRLNQARQLALPPAGAHTDRGGEDEGRSYHEWLRRYDPTDEHSMGLLKKKVGALQLTTRFSVVMPVYNPPIEFLRQAIESVQAQVYPHWELCIADDASPDPAVRHLLAAAAAEDKRIKVVYRSENGHISAASNSALEIATGEFVALMDHDDLLPPHALAHMALAIHEHPGAALIYSDEDKIDSDGRRYDPYFKCDFNRELFLAQNMICHLGVYRKDIVDSIGGFRLGFEGAQDWDLALRFIERISCSNIIHIPRVLYHWRAFIGSTALSADQKPYASRAQVEVVADHLNRVGKLGAMVSPAPGAPGMLRVRYALPEPAPRISIIIPTRDRVDLLRMCISSILERSTYENYEIIIVDNGSERPETKEYFSIASSNNERIKILSKDIPFNYSALNNAGVEIATGDYICLLNNDIEVITPDWMEEMLSFASQPEIGCVGARLWYPNDTLQHGGVVLGIGGVAGHAHKGLPKENMGYFCRARVHQQFSAVTAACLMVSKEIYLDLGGLDELFAVAFNDIDFCIKVEKAGFRNIWTPFAEHYHHESATRGYEDSPEKVKRFQSEALRMQERWADILGADPAYSPNLTLVAEDFSMAWPSRVG